jgi:hypothetical protein
VTYTTSQVAGKIGVRPQTLEKWLLQGLKPPRKRNVDGVFVRLWEEHDLERARRFSVTQGDRPGHRGDPGKAGIRVYTTAEVAAYLKINKMTVMRWISSGRVKKPKLFILSEVGTTWLWTKKELARLNTIRNVLFDQRRRHPKVRGD